MTVVRHNIRTMKHFQQGPGRGLPLDERNHSHVVLRSASPFFVRMVSFMYAQTGNLFFASPLIAGTQGIQGKTIYCSVLLVMDFQSSCNYSVNPSRKTQPSRAPPLRFKNRCHPGPRRLESRCQPGARRVKIRCHSEPRSFKYRRHPDLSITPFMLASKRQSRYSV